MSNIVPIGFKALDFSTNVTFNMENRVFIYLPFLNTNFENTPIKGEVAELNFLEFCFEYNIGFKNHPNIKNIPLFIKKEVITHQKQPIDAIKNFLEDNFDKSEIIIDHKRDNISDETINSINLAIDNIYKDWINTFQKKAIKHKKNITEELLIKELKQIEEFSSYVKIILEDMIKNPLNLDEVTSKYRVNFVDYNSSLVNQVMNRNQNEDQNETIVELINIQKSFLKSKIEEKVKKNNHNYEEKPKFGFKL